MRTEPPDDAEFVGPTRLRPVADVAFEDFYRTHHADMVRMASFLVESIEAAEDLVQDAFVKVQRRWHRIDNPLHYTRRAVTNACRSHHRRRYLERRHLRREQPLVAQFVAPKLLDAIAALPMRQRQAVVLRFYEDLSEKETARIIGCKQGTVGSLVHRAMKTLRGALTELETK